MAFLQEYGPRSVPFVRSGNYLGHVQLMRELETSFLGSPGVRNLSGQQVATYLSFLGRPKEALALFDSVEGSPTDTARGGQLSNYDLEDAVEAIARLADTARVIFVNEAHHVPQHRALTLALLQPLRQRGFRYFAAETFAASDSALNERGYPVRTSGFYTKEPLFGEVVRSAAHLGYRLVPYEASGARSQEDRERGQAQNLLDRIFREDPDARVLLHAGYSHINESGSIAGASPMAMHFRELTGINPVTVDQTTMTEHGETALEHSFYQRILRDHQVSAAAVIRDPSDGRLWSARPNIHDITVIQPRTRLREGRPVWLWSVEGRNRVQLWPDVCLQAQQCVVSARLGTEASDAVPVDRILIDGGMAQPPLLLPAGNFHIVITDESGSVLEERDVVVSRETG